MDYTKMLLDHNIKPSYQRLKVIEYVMLSKDHPTCDEIYENLYNKDGLISKATVYNTMKLFEKQGLVKQFNYDGVKNRYDAMKQPHGHFHCYECNTIYDIDIKLDIEKSHLDGYQIENETIALHGICKACKEKKYRNIESSEL